VLLVYAKKHTGLSSLDWDEAVEEALCFGWIDSKRMPLDARLLPPDLSRRASRRAAGQASTRNASPRSSRPA
jgi:uncharacterized protein YdeI (YjbR/CyaY-like superfamily)